MLYLYFVERFCFLCFSCLSVSCHRFRFSCSPLFRSWPSLVCERRKRATYWNSEKPESDGGRVMFLPRMSVCCVFCTGMMQYQFMSGTSRAPRCFVLFRCQTSFSNFVFFLDRRLVWVWQEIVWKSRPGPLCSFVSLLFPIHDVENFNKLFFPMQISGEALSNIRTVAAFRSEEVVVKNFSSVIVFLPFWLSIGSGKTTPRCDNTSCPDPPVGLALKQSKHHFSWCRHVVSSHSSYPWRWPSAQVMLPASVLDSRRASSFSATLYASGILSFLNFALLERWNK